MIRIFCKGTGAKIVLSSTRRQHWNKDKNHCDVDGRYIDKTFAKFGLSIYDKTPNLGIHAFRRDEICKWLNETTASVDTFVIIDDYRYGWGSLSDHFVKTDPNFRLGIEKEQVTQAIKILNCNKKSYKRIMENISNEIYNFVLSVLNDVYGNIAISKEHISNFAKELTEAVYIESCPLNEIRNKISCFEERILINVATADEEKMEYIFSCLVEELEKNEENAKRIYDSFIEDSRNASCFICSVTGFGEWLSEEQQEQMLNIAQRTLDRCVWGLFVDGVTCSEDESLFYDALRMCPQKNFLTASIIQDSLDVEYEQACRILYELAEKGYISKPDEAGLWKVLITPEEFKKEFFEFEWNS